MKNGVELEVTEDIGEDMIPIFQESMTNKKITEISEIGKLRTKVMELNKSLFISFCVCFVLCFFSLIVGFFIGNGKGSDIIKLEAIRVGVAHYEVNKHGIPKFKWTIKESVIDSKVTYYVK